MRDRVESPLLRSPHYFESLGSALFQPPRPEMARHVSASSVLHDLPLLLLLLAGLCIPLVLLPSPLASLAQGISTLLASLGWLVAITLALILALAALILGEKLINRWSRPISDAGGATATSREGKFEQRQLREQRMEHTVESVIKKAGKETNKLLGGVFQRKPPQGARRGAEGEAVELQELRPTASSSGVRRVPPPLPAR
jgi:membrane protein implicated in regulation of membrane protease activity